MPFYNGTSPIDRKRDAEEMRQILGGDMQPKTVVTPDQNFTPEQIEGMRQILFQHDKAQAINWFDPNRPQIVPYAYREFPKVLYKHEGCLPSRPRVRRTALGEEVLEFLPPVFQTKTVNNEKELKTALAQGWKAEQPNFNTPAEETEAIDGN